MRATLAIAIFACTVALNVAALPVTVVIQSTNTASPDTQDGFSKPPSARHDLAISSFVDSTIVSEAKAPAISSALVRRDEIKDMKELQNYHGGQKRKYRVLASNLSEKAQNAYKGGNISLGQKDESLATRYRIREEVHRGLQQAYIDGRKAYAEANIHEDKAAQAEQERMAYDKMRAESVEGTGRHNYATRHRDIAAAARDTHLDKSRKLRQTANGQIEEAKSDLRYFTDPPPPYSP